MNSEENKQIRLHDFKPGQDHFRAEILSGLRKSQKELPSKYFYDEQGSHLFECICALDEYYIPRTEAMLMEASIEEIVELMGPHILLIEYGCGDCAKVRILLDNLHDPVAYVPIDISREQLLRVTTASSHSSARSASVSNTQRSSIQRDTCHFDLVRKVRPKAGRVLPKNWCAATIGHPLALNILRVLTGIA